MTKRSLSDNEDIVNRYVLVLDTETTGLPRDKYATSSNYNKWDNARLVQIAWEFYNPAKECILRESFIIIPDNFEIPQVVVNIHGISTERAYSEGVQLLGVLDKLQDLLKYNPILVAHNIQFDSGIILAELYRYQHKVNTLNTLNMGDYTQHLNSNLIAKNKTIIDNSVVMWNNCTKHCTMLMGTHPGKKWPKLVNLYQECFGHVPPYELHRADNDVLICAKIYFHLLVNQINGNN